VLTVLLDGGPVQSVTAGDERVVRQIGPLVLTPGGHELRFHPDVVVQTPRGDRRPLSFRVGTWAWHAPVVLQ
jgi:hypothetical protein